MRRPCDRADMAPLAAADDDQYQLGVPLLTPHSRVAIPRRSNGDSAHDLTTGIMDSYIQRSEELINLRLTQGLYRTLFPSGIFT